jgi:hypothetical protein
MSDHRHLSIHRSTRRTTRSTLLRFAFVWFALWATSACKRQLPIVVEDHPDQAAGASSTDFAGAAAAPARATGSAAGSGGSELSDAAGANANVDAGALGSNAGTGAAGSGMASGSGAMSSAAGGAAGAPNASAAGSGTGIDRCATDHGGCDPLASCSSGAMAASCGACPTGYRDAHGDGTLCADVDECATANGDCDERCVNTPGSFNCACNLASSNLDADGHSCHAWSSSVELDDGMGEPAGIVLAMNDAGDAATAWLQLDAAGNNEIVANNYSAGHWGKPVALDPLVAAALSGVQVAIDASGKALVAWEHYDKAWNVLGSFYVAGQWSPTFTIDRYDSGDALAPAMGFDAAGDAFVAWIQKDSASAASIWATRYANGAWETPLQIGDAVANGVAVITTSVNARGDAAVVWSQTVDTKTRLYSTQYSRGAWSAQTEIPTVNVTNENDLVSAIDPTGNVFAAWEESSGSQTSVRANRYSAGSWSSSIRLNDDSEGYATIPQLAVDGSGNVLATWQQANRGTIAVRRFTQNSWQAALELDHGSASSPSSPLVGIDGAGNAVVLWATANAASGGAQLWGNRYTQNKWGPAVQIMSDSTSQLISYRFALDMSGTGIFVWTDRRDMLGTAKALVYQ